MTIKEIEREAFRQIRIKVSDFTDNSNNDEIAGFVKGVVSLESCIYGMLEEESRQSETQITNTAKG